MADDQRGYRKERPLADIIPPDHRRIRTAALVTDAPVSVGKSFIVGAQM